MDLETIAQKLAEEDSIVIAAHIRPDGDAIGSMLALHTVFKKLNKQSWCVVSGENYPDDKFSFLPSFDEFIPASQFSRDSYTYVCLDTPSLKRLGEDSAALLSRAHTTYSLDHHPHVDINPDYLYFNTSAPSASSIVWELSKLMLNTPDKQVAECCYSGLLTDTNSFQNKNTEGYAFNIAQEMTETGINPSDIAAEILQNNSAASLKLQVIMFEHLQVHEDAHYAISWISQEDLHACQANVHDTENFVGIIRSIKGIRVACFIKEDANGIRCSLRAKDDTDVSAIAHRLGGGGHKAAAGADLEGPMLHAVETMERYLHDAMACN